MKNIIPLCFAIAIISSCAAQETKIKGDKDVLSVTENLPSGINTIQIEEGIEVKLVQAKTDNYVLTTDRNLVSVIDFTVKDSVLTIKTNLKITQSKELEVYLKLENPEHIILKNDAKIETPGLIETDNFSLAAYQSSKFDLNVKTLKSQVTLLDNSGGELNLDGEKITVMMKNRTDLKGDFTVNTAIVNLQESAEFSTDGKTDNLTLTGEDRSEFKGRKFEGDNMNVTLNKHAKATIYARDNLTIFAKDRASIEVYGKPEITVKELSDKAEITKK
ncbi:MAG: DUF2807 domain-containing protein [Leeuwenhoekiella sp.]